MTWNGIVSGPLMSRMSPLSSRPTLVTVMTAGLVESEKGSSGLVVRDDLHQESGDRQLAELERRDRELGGRAQVVIVDDRLCHGHCE